MKILFAGGGTGGSVSPLLALAEFIREELGNVDFCWVGTKNGPEKKLVMASDIRYGWIFAGKLRRYFSLRNLVDPFLLVIGFFQSLYLLFRRRPDVVVSAGSFVAVPVGVAAWCLRIPVLVHQLDVRPGLANKILAVFAKRVSVSLPESLAHFPAKKSVHIGNPVRREVLSGNRDKARELLALEPDLPTILVVGGGTGALRVNQLIVGALPELLQFAQVIHLTGKGKKLPPLALKEKSHRYHQFEFLINELPDVLAAADIVITRAGMGFLTELAALGKVTLIVPIPNSHQEDNAQYFCSRGAAVCLQEQSLSSQSLVADLQELWHDENSRMFLSRRIREFHRPDAARVLTEEIMRLYHTKHGDRDNR